MPNKLFLVCLSLLYVKTIVHAAGRLCSDLPRLTLLLLLLLSHNGAKNSTAYVVHKRCYRCVTFRSYLDVLSFSTLFFSVLSFPAFLSSVGRDSWLPLLSKKRVSNIPKLWFSTKRTPNCLFH